MKCLSSRIAPKSDSDSAASSCTNDQLDNVQRIETNLVDDSCSAGEDLPRNDCCEPSSLYLEDDDEAIDSFLEDLLDRSKSEVINSGVYRCSGGF
jgi:hypothetical protein